MKIRVLNSQTLGELKELNLAIATKIEGECLVGRSPNSSLVLDSPDVSRLHGKFFLENGNYYFSDLGSSNGSIINGKLAETNQRYVLKAGDIIRIGEFVLITEEIIPVPEDLPATVIGNIDATVLSDWRAILKLKTPEVANQAAEAVSEPPKVISQSPEAIKQAPAVSGVPEVVIVESELMSQSPEEVSEASGAAMLQEVNTIQSLEEVKVPEVMSQTPEVVSDISEKTYIQADEIFTEATVSEVATTQAPETAREDAEEIAQTPEAEFSEQTYIQVPELLEQAAVLEAITPAPEEVNAVPEVTAYQEVTIIQTPAAENAEAGVPSPEVVSAVSEPVTQTSEESTAPEAIAQVEAGSEAPMQVEAPEDCTQLPADVSEIPEIASEDLSSIQAAEEEETYVQAPELFQEDLAAITPASEKSEQVAVSNFEVDTTQAPEAVSEVFEEMDQTLEAVDVSATNYIHAPEASEEATASEAITQTPTAVTEAPEVITRTPEEAQEETEVSEVVTAQTSEVSKAFEIISKKHIALMAHDSKKSDLAQFVSQHKDFLSKCLTIATPSISETLHQQTGVAISQKTPSIPVGGYQTVASLIGTADVLAVIFSRDFMVTQSSQANEEALLRLCNINQVLLATNVSTAEAVMYYIKDMITSL